MRLASRDGRLWRVDLHTHTLFSPDSATEPADLIARACAVGLDRVAVTDHNTTEGAEVACRLAPDLVIVGEEIETAEGGELIAYFVREAVPAHLPVAETLRRLRQQGAVISISHPVDRWRGSAMGEELTRRIAGQVDALEVFNSRCLSGLDNTRARTLAAEYDRAVTAGSDAHTIGEIGAAYLELPPFENSPESFCQAWHRRAAGRLSGPWPHFASTYARWQKRRVLRR